MAIHLCQKSYGTIKIYIKVIMHLESICMNTAGCEKGRDVSLQKTAGKFLGRDREKGDHDFVTEY